MSGEKDIPKFDGDRSNYEAWYMNINAHLIRGKFDDVFVNEKHPELPDDGINAPKDEDKSKAKRIKRFLRKNNRAVADI